jgi:CRP-like cAMP-binding protein
MNILNKNILFRSMTTEDIMQLLEITDHMEKKFLPGEVIVHQGDIIENIGIMLSGNTVGKKYTPDGEEIIVSNMGVNSIFGDVLSGAIGFASPVTVLANTDCRVLFINYQQLLFSQSPLTHRVLQNMIQNISRKYFAQNKRMDILMLKSVRSKVLAYLEWQKTVHDSPSFEIDLDRRLLADFLGVERSALSRELSRMKKDGLIDCHKNSFTLLV